MTEQTEKFRPIVLIAQHDIKDLSLLEKACVRYNRFDVVTASCGEEVVDRINDHCFDAVFIGLKFPDITGATLAYLIREFDPLITIGFLTSYNTPTLIDAVESLDCVFLDKNKEMQDLDSLCEKLYDITSNIPCVDELRTSERSSSEVYRNRYRQYHKLSIPKVIKKGENCLWSQEISQVATK